MNVSLCRLWILCALLAPWHEAAAKSQRIVSLAPSATELLFALGVGDQVVGVTRYDDYPPEVVNLPKVGGFIDPDAEAVLALHPDLVVAIPTSGGRRPVETLTRLGLHVLVLPGATLSDLWRGIDLLGEATHHEDDAARLRTRLQGELRAAGEQRGPQTAPTPQVVLVVGQKPLVVAGPGSFLDELLTCAHGHNVVQRGGSYPILDWEALLQLKPDVLIDLSQGGSLDFWRQGPGLRSRVVRLDPSLLSRAGPRLPQALRQLRDAIWATP